MPRRTPPPLPARPTPPAMPAEMALPDPDFARECLTVARRGQRLMAYRPDPRRRRAAPPKTPPHAMALLANLAQSWRATCRRADCRRRFTCAFGARRRDAAPANPHLLPCIAALPKAVSFALAVAVNARGIAYDPEEPGRRRREEELMRIARGDLADLEAAAQRSAAAARDAGSCRSAS